MNSKQLPANESLDSIVIKSRSEQITVNMSDILFLKSDGLYTEIHTVEKQYISSKNLGDYEKFLPGKTFFRTHHSYIVNLRQIKAIEKNRTGKLFLFNGAILPVSQRKMNDFLSRYNSDPEA